MILSLEPWPGAARAGGLLPPVGGVPPLLLRAHGVRGAGAQPAQPGQVDTVPQDVQRTTQGNTDDR